MLELTEHTRVDDYPPPLAALARRSRARVGPLPTPAAAAQARPGAGAPWPLRPYVVGCGLVAAAVTALVVVIGPDGGLDPPEIGVLLLLRTVTVAAGVVKVNVPAGGDPGIFEYTSLVELAAVLLMVFLEPGWAIALAASANVASEVLSGRREVTKIGFNTAARSVGAAPSRCFSPTRIRPPRELDSGSADGRGPGRSVGMRCGRLPACSS